MTEIQELREEIRRLREEIALLRASRQEHHYHHYPPPIVSPPPMPVPWSPYIPYYPIVGSAGDVQPHFGFGTPTC